MATEYEIQPSPALAKSKSTFDFGVRGTWTPSITFATPGDLSVTYGTRKGMYYRFGDFAYASFWISTSVGITHTTASGLFLVSGFPYNASFNNEMIWLGATAFSGWTKATHTQVTLSMEPDTRTCSFNATGSGVSLSAITSANVPSGTTIALTGNAWYRTTDVI